MPKPPKKQPEKQPPPEPSAAPPPPDPEPQEDLGMTARIHANAKALVWSLYERSAGRHINLQRRDRNARRLALLLNPPGSMEEFEAATTIAGAVFAERAACVAAVRTVQEKHADEGGKAAEILEEAITALQARGPVKIAPEWETDDPDAIIDPIATEVSVAMPATAED